MDCPQDRKPQPISLLPHLHKSAIRDLHTRGITTLEQIAAMSISELRQIKGIKTSAEAIRAHAQAFTTNQPVWFGALPEILLEGGWMMDIETVMPENALVWSIGWCDVMGRYDSVVVNAYHDPCTKVEGGRTIQIVDDADEAWRVFALGVDDGRPVFHWSQFDHGVMKRHAPVDVRERLNGRMIDLLGVFDKTVKLPLRSSSLKKVAPHVSSGMAWVGSADALIAHRDYQEWLETGDQHALAQACRYQYGDVVALWRVWEWLISAHPGILVAP